MTPVDLMPARRVRSSPFILLLILSAVMPPVTACDAPTAERFSVLVFSRTAGFRHESIPAGLNAHTNESFSERLFLEHLLGGIVWAAGVAPGDSSATATRRKPRGHP